MFTFLAEAFKKFPKESELIGGLLAGYADLEIATMNCVGSAREHYYDVVLKTMYRSRGEAQRINIANALGRELFEAAGLAQQFAEAIAAIDYCRKIRNQYAHSVWHDDNSGKLCFVDLEQLARTNAVIKDLQAAKYEYVDVPVLQAQFTYYVYVEHLFVALGFEIRARTKRLEKNPVDLPKPLPRAAMHL